MKLDDDARRSLPHRQDVGPARPRDADSRLDAGTRSDWLARATAIAARWLPLPRVSACADIICIAHGRSATAVVSCEVCAYIMRRRPRHGPRHAEGSASAALFRPGAQ